MSSRSTNPLDILSSDDSDLYDFFPSSPSSHRLTSPPPAEARDGFLDHWMVPKQRTLPLELIEYIIELFYRRYRSFRALRALSEASSQLRLITLRRYMTSLDIRSEKHLTSLLDLHISILSRSNTEWERVGFQWVKTLTAQCAALAKAPWRANLLSSLQSLHVSFAQEARSTQKIRLQQIFDIPLSKSPMTHLTSLTLTGLWRIDTFLLNIVARAFPGLLSLHLSCTEHLDLTCCWACFEESSSAVIHSPVPNQFPTVKSLTSAFAKELKPLTKLIDLHLGIFLSDEDMLENHIDHYNSPRAYSRALRNSFVQNRNHTHTGTILSQSESPHLVHLEHVSYTQDEGGPESPETTTFDEVPPFPHGPEMCPICAIIVSAPEVRTRELEASLALAQKLKSIRTVSWSSFFAWKIPAEEERRIGDWQRMTKTYVLHSGGRVRVRRRPWD